MAEPLVSIVMCAFNVRKYIEGAVDCILKQTYTNWELIIGDDGSTDGTREWLRETMGEMPKVRLIFHPQNLGYLRNKNHLHQQAKGEYITQLDADDTCPENRLQMQVEAALSTGYKLIGGGYNRIDGAGKIVASIHPDKDIILTERPGNNYPFWFPSLLVHKSVFEAVGYFNKYFIGIYGDDNYWTMLANSRFSIYCLKKIIYNYHFNPQSLTNVLDNERKMLVPYIMEELTNMFYASGGDVLSVDSDSHMKNFETSLTANRKFMAEQYRLWAAKATDKKDYKTAARLLAISSKKNMFNFNWYRTAAYYLRSKILKGE